MLITAIGSHINSVEEPVMVVTAVTDRNASIYYQVTGWHPLCFNLITSLHSIHYSLFYFIQETLSIYETTKPTRQCQVMNGLLVMKRFSNEQVKFQTDNSAFVISTQACKVINSTSCECPTPGLSGVERGSETEKPPGTCEFEMMYHDFQDDAEVNIHCNQLCIFIAMNIHRLMPEGQFL